MATSVADVDAVIPNGIKTFLANILSTFCIKGRPDFDNASNSTILDN